MSTPLASAMGRMLLVTIMMITDQNSFSMIITGFDFPASLGREVVKRGLKRLPRITCLDPGVIVSFYGTVSGHVESLSGGVNENLTLHRIRICSFYFLKDHLTTFIQLTD